MNLLSFSHRQVVARPGSSHIALLMFGAVLAGSLLVGCQNQSSENSPNSPNSQTGSSGFTGGDVVAMVNKEPITSEQFYDQMQHWVPANVANFPQNPVLGEPAGRVALQELIENMVVVQIAKTQGVPVTQAQIDSSYNDSVMLQQAAYTLPFESLLSQQGFTTDQFKQEVLVPRIAQQNLLGQTITITPDELQASYNATLKNYQQPNRVHIHRVVLATKAAADAVYQGLKSGKQMSDFNSSNLAPIAPDGNPSDTSDIPRWVSLDNPSPALAPVYASFKTSKVGDILPPTQLQGGQWWVIQVVEKQPSDTLPFSQVEDIVRINLLQQKAGAGRAQLTAMVQKYLQNAEITINLPQYESLAMQLKTPMPVPTAPPPSPAPAH